MHILPLFLSIYLSVCLSVCLSIYPSINQSTYLSGWLSKCWFLSSVLLPHLHWGPLHKYLVGLSYLHFNKIQDKMPFVWQVQYRGLFLLASLLSVLSLLSLPLTSSRLSRMCLGDLKYSWLGWPTSWLAGWLPN